VFALHRRTECDGYPGLLQIGIFAGS